MKRPLMTSAEFRDMISHLESGTWQIAYQDRTHMSEDQWIRLGELTFYPNGTQLCDDTCQVLVPYTFSPAPLEELCAKYASIWPKKKKDNQANDVTEVADPLTGTTIRVSQSHADACRTDARRVYDALTHAAMWCGLIAPVVDPCLLREMLEDPSPKLFIADVNAITQGTLLWFSKAFASTSVWIAVVVSAQMIAQQASETLKSKAYTQTQDNRLLRTRWTANGIPLNIKRLQEEFPVEFIQLPSELLRVFNGGNTSDERGFGIPEDRFILEGIRYHLKERTLTGSIRQYFITGDYDFARHGKAERLVDEWVLTQLPPLETKIQSVRFDPFRREFVFTPWQRFIWDLASIFSRIKVTVEKTGETYIIDFYNSSSDGEVRTLRQWDEDRLYVQHVVSTAVNAPVQTVAPAWNETFDVRSFADDSKGVARKVSLENVLLAVNALAQLDTGIQYSKEVLVERFPPQSEDSISRLLSVMQAIGFVAAVDGAFVVTELVPYFMEAWDRYDLPEMDRVFRNYAAYRRIAEMLETLGELPLDDVSGLEAQLYPEGPALLRPSGYQRIRSWHVAVGTAYQAASKLYFGGNTPTLDEFARVFTDAMLNRGTPGTQVPAEEIVDSVCKQLRISPQRLNAYLVEALSHGYINVEPITGSGAGQGPKYRQIGARTSPHVLVEKTIDAGIEVSGVIAKAFVIREATH